MSLKYRFLVILLILIGVFIGSIMLLNLSHRNEELESLAFTRKEKADLLGRLIKYDGYALDLFSRDYSQWGEMVDFVSSKDPEWAKVNLDDTLAAFSLDVIAVYEPNGSVIHTANSDNMRKNGGFPTLHKTTFHRAAEQKFLHYFHNLDGHLIEIRIAPIVPSDDTPHDSTPSGWLVGGKIWDVKRIEDVAILAGTTLELVLDPAPPGSNDRSVYTFMDIDARHVAELLMSYQPPIIESVLNFNARESTIFVLYGVTLIGVTSFLIWLWILNPLNTIVRSISENNPDLLWSLMNSGTEIGNLARMVRTNALSQQAITQSMKARIMLGRDLHDGVIQSIYAAGMAISLARGLVKSDPVAAEAKLDQVREMINGTIRETRTLIAGMEVSTERTQTFAEIIAPLVRLMKSIRTSQIHLDIDELLAANFTTPQKTHLLQILREALSNSLRHGSADEIHISLTGTPAHTVLAIRDNGSGFDIATVNANGHGLFNMRERAESLGATFGIESSPGTGTLISITFSSPITHP